MTARPVVLVDMDGRECETTECGAKVSGRTRFCPDCKVERRRESAQRHYLANRDQIIARSTKRNKETRPAERKRYHNRYKTKKLARIYGTTIEHIERLLAITVCAICGSTDRKLHIDHDHKSGEIRGRLCSRCNTGIGLLGENIAVLRSAIDYLEHF